VARFLPVQDLVGKSLAPGVLGLESVISQETWVFTKLLAGRQPALLPYLNLLLRARRQFLGGQEGGRVGRDLVGFARPVLAHAMSARQRLGRCQCSIGSGIVKVHFPLEYLDLGLVVRVYLQAEFRAPIHQIELRRADRETLGVGRNGGSQLAASTERLGPRNELEVGGAFQHHHGAAVKLNVGKPRFQSQPAGG
jgi:hypothetical protein